MNKDFQIAKKTIQSGIVALKKLSSSFSSSINTPLDLSLTYNSTSLMFDTWLLVLRARSVENKISKYCKKTI